MFRYLCAILIVVVSYADGKPKTRLLSLEKCKLPDDQWDKDNLFDSYWYTNRVDRQTTLVYANVTIKNKVGPVTIDLKTYALKQDLSRHLVFKLEKVSCKMPLVNQLLKSIKLKLDDDCNMLPGTTTLSDGINVDYYSWLLATIAPTPGRYVFVIAMMSKKGYLECVDAICSVYVLM